MATYDGREQESVIAIAPQKRNVLLKQKRKTLIICLEESKHFRWRVRVEDCCFHTSQRLDPCR